MSNTIEFEGRTEQEAVAKACAALKLPEAKLDYTMLDEGSAGVFGLGARPVRIRVRAPEGAAVAEAAPRPSASASPSMGDNGGAASARQAPPAGVESSTPAPASQESDFDDDRGGIVGPAPEKAAKALEVAKGLSDRMGLKATITVRDENEQIVVVIEEAEGGVDVAETLGKSRPPAIPSFQFLLNKIVNRFPDDRKHIIVEVPSVPRKERREPRRQEARGERGDRPERGDRGDRPERGDRPPQPPVELDPNLDPTLVAMGRFLAERAQQLGKVITVHPMLPSDRRAVHQTIMSLTGVHTISEGEGLYRRMHVIPDALKEGGNGKRRRRRRRRGRGRGGSGESRPSEAGDEGGAEAGVDTGVDAGDDMVDAGDDGDTIEA